MSADEFWECTPREFACKQKGFSELYKQKEEEAWRRTIAQINIWLPKGKKVSMNFNRKPMRLPSRDESERVRKRFDRGKINGTRESKLSIPR